MDLILSGTALWIPQPGPQTEALLSEADEVFYGGAAGGGKSDLLMGAAILYGDRAVMFRRHYTDVEFLVERSEKIIGTAGRYNAQTHVWRLDGRRSLAFGALRHDKDWKKWQGRPYDHQLWDEVTQFTLKVYQTLSAWNRTTVPGQRSRRICSFNPPQSPDEEWVIDYLAPWLRDDHPNPAAPGEIRWFAMVDGEEIAVATGEPFEHKGEMVEPSSRTFIPATLADNAYLGPEYRRKLMSLPEPMRSQMLYGDMKAAQKDDAWQVIPTQWIRLAQERWHEGRPTYEGDDGERVPVPMTGMGIDVARGGEDESAIACLYDYWVDTLIVRPGTDTPKGQDTAKLVRSVWDGKAPMAIDVIGVGGSPYDILSDVPDVTITGINNSGSSGARAKEGNAPFVNMRAEVYWKLREALDPDGDERLALPPDRDLEIELRAHRYSQNARGIAIESKKEVKKRIGRSPDRADSVTLALKASRTATFL